MNADDSRFTGRPSWHRRRCVANSYTDEYHMSAHPSFIRSSRTNLRFIGSEIVAQLLLHNIRKVYILARSKSKYQRAQENWRKRHGIVLSENDDKVEFIQCDLGDIKSVKDAAEEVRAKTDRLDILICNAGKLYLSIPQPLQLLTVCQKDWACHLNTRGHLRISRSSLLLIALAIRFWRPSCFLL
jgi:NAD(P)-dependent dehydrogenase (short-subunit alcohol dehydrogenase family)